MELTAKPQPLIGELLPGFTLAAILASAYALHDRAALGLAVHYAGSGSVVAGCLVILLLLLWVLGTLTDAIRDLIEWALDHYWFELNWAFLQHGEVAQIEKLQESWLAYYYLTGNLSVAIFVCLLLSLIYRSVVPLSLDVSIILVCILAIFVANTALLRLELRHLMVWLPSSNRPHDGVFTRLGVSSAQRGGVGVFAIRDIPEGADVFGADDSPTVSVRKDETKTLHPAIRKLYHDFCVLRGDVYECPVSFNSLTVSWYLNCSKRPNVKADSELRFTAVEDIKAGDELFADYDDYSENEDGEFNDARAPTPQA